MSIIRKSKETDVITYFNEKIGRFFNIYPEVWGTHITGCKKRIDAIITPKQFLLDRSFPEIPIGVEIKTDLLEDGNKKQVIELYHQTIVYRHTRFNFQNSLRFLPLILIYPPMTNYLKHEESKFSSGFRYFASRLCGLFFIGELFLPKDKDSIEFLIHVCGTDYFTLKNNGQYHKWNSNWGFEVYEREIGLMVEQGKITPKEYEKQVMILAEKLGI